MTDRAHMLERWTALATAFIALLLGFFAMNDVPLGIFQDDGHYLILARAIAEGEGYRYTNLPGAPAATHFPPGFPLLLAPIWWIAPHFPANVAWFKLVNVALLPAAALAIRALAQRSAGLSAPVASVLAVAAVSTVPVLFLNGLLFSETVFIAALCAALVVFDRLLADEDTPSARTALLLGLGIGALTLLRTLGAALFPAVVAPLLWRRQWRAAALVTGGALALLAPWQAWASVHADAVPAAIAGGYGGYGAWLANAWREGGFDFAWAVVAENARGLLIPLTLFGLSDASAVLKGVAVLVLLLLVGAGAWSLRRRASATVLFLFPYLALLIAWPFPPDRFLWPLWPVALMLLARGTAHTSAAGMPRAVRVASPLAAAALGVAFLAWHAQTWPTRSWERGERGNARMGLAAAGVAASLPAEGLVASDQDAMVHLYAKRPAVPLLALTAVQHVRTRTDAEVAAQLGGVLDAYRPRWVIVGERESLRAAQALTRAGRLRLAGADTSGVLLYDVVR
jgi:hypothetical protein